MSSDALSVGVAQSDGSDEMRVSIHIDNCHIKMGTDYAKYFVTQILLAIEYAEKANKGGEDD